MKKIILILGLATLIGCSKEEILTDNLTTQNTGQMETEIDYKQAILGEWKDTEEVGDARFEKELAYFTAKDTTLGGYPYWIKENQLTVKYGTYMEITKEIQISGDVLIFGAKEYTRK